MIAFIIFYNLVQRLHIFFFYMFSPIQYKLFCNFECVFMYGIYFELFFTSLRIFSITIFKDTIVFSHMCTIIYPFLSCWKLRWLLTLQYHKYECMDKHLPTRFLCASGNFQMVCPSLPISSLVRGSPASPFHHPPQSYRHS